MIKVFYDLRAGLLSDTVLTLGMFDGVHIAHRQIISECVLRAKKEGRKSVFLTYDPHPQQVISTNRAAPFKVLSTPEEKLKKVEELGIDIAVVVNFTSEFAALSADDFLKNIYESLGPSEIVTGYRTTFGHNRLGNSEILRTFAEDKSIKLSLIEPIELSGLPVSSSNIRKLLFAGGIKNANIMLGSAYTFTGVVIDGDKRGRSLGFKTANIEPNSADKLIPADGVYACDTTISNKVYRAVVNIGTRPTFERDFSIEAHILDFDEDIYGKEITLCFLDRLRDVQKFNGKDALIAAINADIAAVQKL